MITRGLHWGLQTWDMYDNGEKGLDDNIAQPTSKEEIKYSHLDFEKEENQQWGEEWIVKKFLNILTIAKTINTTNEQKIDEPCY